jgi:hypothetical protein
MTKGSSWMTNVTKTIYKKGSDMDATLRFLTFLLLTSCAFLLLVPSILNSITFWLKVFEVTIK